jgi:hypothetical protein
MWRRPQGAAVIGVLIMTAFLWPRCLIGGICGHGDGTVARSALPPTSGHERTRAPGPLSAANSSRGHFAGHADTGGSPLPESANWPALEATYQRIPTRLTGPPRFIGRPGVTARSAPHLRRGALLIRGPWRLGPGSAEQRCTLHRARDTHRRVADVVSPDGIYRCLPRLPRKARKPLANKKRQRRTH